MWPFRKKNSDADNAIAVMDRAIELCARRRIEFRASMPFREGTPLQEQIAFFAVPMEQGLRNAFPALQRSPDSALFLFIVKGIKKSGTHSTSDIEAALGFEIPQ